MNLKYVFVFLAALVLCFACAGCENNNEGVENEMSGYLQFAPLQEGESVVIMHTDEGDITLRFFPEEAPKAVENFLTHAKEGYYDNTFFHRVIPNFMMQGGDPEGTGMGGESIWGEPFGVEESDKLFHFTGALAMAKTMEPISIGSQFYIVHGEPMSEMELKYLESYGYAIPDAAREGYMQYGGSPHLDGGYTVFGQVVEGMDVVEKIMSYGSQSGAVAKQVHITSMEVLEYTEAE